MAQMTIEEMKSELQIFLNMQNGICIPIGYEEQKEIVADRVKYLQNRIKQEENEQALGDALFSGGYLIAGLAVMGIMAVTD